jgi:hypothetical protein
MQSSIRITWFSVHKRNLLSHDTFQAQQYHIRLIIIIVNMFPGKRIIRLFDTSNYCKVLSTFQICLYGSVTEDCLSFKLGDYSSDIFNTLNGV